VWSLASSLRRESRKTTCQGTLLGQAKMCSFNSCQTRGAHIGLSLANSLHVPSGGKKVVGPFGNENLLSVFWCAQSFGLGIPGNGVENPGVPAVGSHDALGEGGTAGSVAEPPGDVASETGASKREGCFRSRDEWNDLGRC
jgi:hypothetical protein